MTKIEVALAFTEPDTGYIGLPYWPEKDMLINVSKDVHPKLGDTKKEAAIIASCEKRGISKEQYKHMIDLAARPFYTIDGTREGEIIIPQRIIQSFVNHTSMAAPKSVPRITEKGLTFIALKIQDGFLRTGKSEKDAKMFGRFVKNDASNQRQWANDFYIHEFHATGTLLLDEETGEIESDKLQKLFEYGGRMYGVGSARPQGFGRFQVTRWNVLGEKPTAKPKAQP